MKSRILLIFPEGIQQNLKSFTENLGRYNFNLNGKDKYRYRYKGHLKDIPNTIVLIYYELNGCILKSDLLEVTA